MKIKYFSVATAGALALSLFAQASPAAQFMLIVRSKTDVQASPDKIQTNIKHWQVFMSGLAGAGELAGGYRPGADGLTLSGPDKKEKTGSYTANGEVVSSFLIINAPDLAKAREIAAKCPVFELDGSVEIRPMQNTAR